MLEKVNLCIHGLLYVHKVIHQRMGREVFAIDEVYHLRVGWWQFGCVQFGKELVVDLYVQDLIVDVALEYDGKYLKDERDCLDTVVIAEL